jgi:hypothetical protein
MITRFRPKRVIRPASARVENWKTRRRPGPWNSSPAWATFGPRTRSTARSSLRDTWKRSEGLGRETQLPPGPNSAQDAMNRSSAMDGGERFSLEQNRRAAWLPRNPSHFCFLPRLRLHPSEWASERNGRRSGAVARLLFDGRHSPEGERAVVEQSCCDALIRELEPVNPRVEHRRASGFLPGLRWGQIWRWLDPGKSRASYSYARVSENLGIFRSFFNPVFIHSYSCDRNSRSKQIESA